MKFPIDKNIRRYFSGLVLPGVALLLAAPAGAVINARMQTDLGGIDILLRDDVAPITVSNFLDYADTAAFDGTFIHRNIPGFVVQGGGYIFEPDNGSFFAGGATHIPTNEPIMNEAVLPGALSNIRGTMAMAKSEGDPDSATSEWFFNLVDNSGNLDEQNGGFTVFAEVPDKDMEIVDIIASQDVCKQLNGIGGFLCANTPFADMILMKATDPLVNFDPDRLLFVKNVGIDSDTDGVIDRIENAGPNGGDGNNDSIADSTQAGVASYAAANGDVLTVTATAGVQLRSIDTLGSIFVLSKPLQFCTLNGFEFRQDYIGFELTGIAAGGATAVTITLPADGVPDTYFSYGPTPDNPDPHWYEFSFDGETGLELDGNTLALHFADGRRGDADLDGSNGVIVHTGGFARHLAELIDDDGVPDGSESQAPNNGDGNQDGTQDQFQGDVASFGDLNGIYLTVATNTMVPLRITDNNYQPVETAPGMLDFNHGLIRFEMCSGSTATASLILPEGEAADTFYSFGPTPDNPDPHYYEFMYDGETGAELNGNLLTLHFVDGRRGDHDLLANGTIMAGPGGPALLFGDSDGIPDAMEDAGPNNGDGNKDGIADRLQNTVATLTDINANYLTLETDEPFRLQSIQITNGAALIAQNPPPPRLLDGYNLLHGFVDFEIHNLGAGDAAILRLILPEGTSPATYFVFGPTPDNTTPHWYEFKYDGITGAQITGNVVTLHLVDGLRGDADLQENGIIVDPGAPAVSAGTSGGGSGGGGGGCSMLQQTDANPRQAGAWWLLAVVLVLLRRGASLRRKGRIRIG